MEGVDKMWPMYLIAFGFALELYFAFASLGVGKATASLFAIAGFIAVVSIYAAVKCGIETAKK